MKTCKLILEDEVNCRFVDLEPDTRRKLVAELSFTPGYARHTPAFKMGRWDGKVSFATVGGGSFVNLLDRLIPIVETDGYKIDLEDRRVPFPVTFTPIDENYLSEYRWPEGHRLAGENIVLADHQVRAANIYFENVQSLQELSTGAGKTVLCAALVRQVEEAVPGGRTLTIVPSKSLVEQTYDDYLVCGRDVGKFFGEKKEWGHRHIVATWQSLSAFAKKDRQGRIEVDRSFAEFLEGVVCVIVDEAHSSKAMELRSLLSDKRGGAMIPIRWGMTGTIPEEEYEYVAIHAVIGPVVGEVTAKELMDKGILASCHIHILQTDEKHLVFKDYHEAYKYLVTDEHRMRWLANYCMELQKTGNVLILYDRYATADVLEELIDDLVIVNGEMSLKKRKKEYKSFDDETKIICAATYGVAAVGINIPALHHIVMVESGKSGMRVIQSIGRGLRITNKKKTVEIHDFGSNNKFAARHLTARKKHYKKALYPFTVHNITIE